MERKPSLESTITARDRILSAAILRFSRQSYDTTGLREIAADASVDVAYVHRCFGSKRQLFAEAVNKVMQADRVFDEPPDNLADTLTRRVFERDSTKIADDVGPLDIMVRSLSCPEAIGVLHDAILKDFVEPLSESFGAPAMRRAALIAAFLAGISIFRNVIGIEVLRETEGGELEAMVGGTLRTMMSKSVPARRK
jgi:AcrR family transcriptional regulator